MLMSTMVIAGGPPESCDDAHHSHCRRHHHHHDADGFAACYGGNDELDEKGACDDGWLSLMMLVL